MPSNSNSSYPRPAKRALGSEENSGCLTLIDSEMAGLIRLKLCAHRERERNFFNNLAKYAMH